MKYWASLTWPDLFWLIFWAIVISQFPISFFVIRGVIRRRRHRKLVADRVAAIADGEL